MSRLAVVLFNLGGPDSLDSVRPFLFNLFHDPAIIGIPQPIRWILAQIISRRREPIAKQIYGSIGGKSPLTELTQEQALALKFNLKDVAEISFFKLFLLHFGHTVLGSSLIFCISSI